MVKLYSYSSELLTFVEATWAKAKLATCGILIGTIIFFGFIKLDQSVGNVLGSRSAKTLAAENDFLRQQISLISPRVSKLEMRARQLREHADKLQMLIVGDTLSRFMFATKVSESQSLIPTATNFGP
jgi:hypothetical protein